MADYNYTARSKEDKTVKGKISAENQTKAIEALGKQGLKPLVVQPAKTGFDPNNLKLPAFMDKVKTKSLVVFTRQLATLVNAGVPIVRSLSTLQQQTDSELLKKQLAGVVSTVTAGGSFADALSKYPKTFSSVYVNMVRAGEAGGILDDVLIKLAIQQEKDAAMRSKIRGAMVYPGVISVVTFVAFFLLMTIIVPKIGGILKDMGSKLPIYTQILLNVSDFLKKPIVIVAILFGIPMLIIAFNKYKATKKGRYKWHKLLLKIPTIKGVVAKVAISRFARTFGALMSAGVPIVEAINTTAGAVGNAVIEKELQDSARDIQTGKSFSERLAESQYFPPMVSQMLAIGEETGKTDEIILKVSEFYEEEVDTIIGSISSIIEPVMIIVLGGLVGLIAISVFGPITQLSTSVH